MAHCSVGYQADIYSVMLELKCRKLRALHYWPGFSRNDTEALAGFPRRPDHAKRGAVGNCCKRAGVAVGEHDFAVPEELCTDCPHLPVSVDVFLGHFESFIKHDFFRLMQHSRFLRLVHYPF